MGDSVQLDNQCHIAQAIQEYRETHDLELRNDLVMHFSYIAKTVALQMRSITSSYAQVEDIINQGILTLMDCVERYDPSKGLKFEAYAYARVKNANIDYVRKQDWVPRRVRKTAKDLIAAHDTLANQLLREPTTAELAAHMGITEEQLSRSYSETAGTLVMSFENLLEGGNPGGTFTPTEPATGQDTQPEAQILAEERTNQLCKALDKLTERERLVVSLYYHEKLKLHEIAQVLSVSESRVCQIHGKAILKLRQYMVKYENG